MQLGSRQSATSLSAIDVDTPPQLFAYVFPLLIYDEKVLTTNREHNPKHNSIEEKKEK